MLYDGPAALGWWRALNLKAQRPYRLREMHLVPSALAAQCILNAYAADDTDTPTGNSGARMVPESIPVGAWGHNSKHVAVR